MKLLRGAAARGRAIFGCAVLRRAGRRIRGLGGPFLGGVSLGRLRLRTVGLPRLRPVALAGVISDVPTTSLELDGRGGEQLLHGLTAGRTGGERRVREL